MICRLQKENPAKKFYCPSEHFICADMKLTTLGWIAHSLETMTYEVKVAGSMREKAKRSLNAMLAVLPKEEKKR